ncbi:metal ABC transporter solute-binding protein, Zn/Mn family [Gilvimarinus xylanilyticus]|uniref:High-affinity zinc uptake system protein ZnuA n=1 Tax=Gilvimarinus xylanilyticus TaxID=2944139 RepID=A0A9X2I393_9GAMM|nr:zinc ABC transporter substrate-binding protein [Gilvimarinus xylanilyticus]MCP8900023.1 zinc ABC transporter substrate-binding protein [Gilvimarinus xylanilyticus]
MLSPLFPRIVAAWRALVLLAATAMSSQVYAQPLELVTSIKPLALIAREITAEDDQVVTLLPPGVSPHAYNLRMSDRRLLDDADLLLWVGPELETFLRKPLQSQAQKLLTLSELAGLEWPEAGASHDHDHDHHHHGDGADMHLWLNPRNAVVVARALGERLAELRPANAVDYRRRVEAFAAQIDLLDAELENMLSKVKDQGFAVYHDGYRHFVDHFGLNQVDFVSLTPEQTPGARHLYHLQQHLGAEAVCLFTEPYADTRAARDLAHKLDLRSAELDPLAANERANTYAELLMRLGQSFSACLAASKGG